MSDFEKAKEEVTQLSKSPDNLMKLRLYALYKQSTEGDAGGDRPGALNMVGRAKYDAWAALKGTSKEEAKQQYIALVEELKEMDKRGEL
jgi:acyl-CoA-binding protein